MPILDKTAYRSMVGCAESFFKMIVGSSGATDTSSSDGAAGVCVILSRWARKFMQRVEKDL